MKKTLFTARSKEAECLELPLCVVYCCLINKFAENVFVFAHELSDSAIISRTVTSYQLKLETNNNVDNNH